MFYLQCMTGWECTFLQVLQMDNDILITPISVLIHLHTVNAL